MRRNEITYVNNNVHNNPHLLSASLKTTLHTFSLRWHGAWHTINTRVAQKQNPKALQENPAQQATEGRTGVCGLPPVRLQCRPTPPEPERGPQGSHGQIGSETRCVLQVTSAVTAQTPTHLVPPPE